MFKIITYLTAALCYKVFAEELSPVAVPVSVKEPLLDDLSIGAFLDKNGYIRLNITWGQINYGIEYISIYFNNNEECNPLSDVEFFPADAHFIITPSMELEHPADHLMHGCVYNISVEDKTSSFSRYQSLTYQVPECVENKCQCREHDDSPNKLTSISPLSDGVFLVTWNKSSAKNVTVHYIYYQRMDIKDSIRTYIPEKSLHYKKNAVEIPMRDLKQDIAYTVTVVFIDEYNECVYFSSIGYTVSSPRRTLIFVISGITLLVVLVLIYIFLLYSPRIRRKLVTYLRFLPQSYRTYQYHDNDYLSTPLSQLKVREEINAQYTPLEFVLKMHKYDEYEFPRNKIVIKEEIGHGAFGNVYYAKAYELGDKQGFTMVAVKQLREGAPEEEILDFQAEIEILKKVGKHENIIKLLGCVTMDEPYMMIMELVPCGSLKNYLLNLRQQWAKRKQQRIFFPDDMDENWLNPNIPKRSGSTGKINYTSCVFDNSQSSYIVPETHPHQPPRSPGGIVFVNKNNNSLKPTYLNLTNKFPQNFVENSPCTPHSPSSMNSSRLPSSTETEMTNIDNGIQTPSITEMSNYVEPVLDHTELQQFAFQIANGMAYLEKLPITHRDLAARNILITSNKMLKISDFGMSRSGPYVNHKSKKLPLRWMAVEAIEDRTCDSKSDVWSFGIVLWEIGTLGAFPYEHTPDALILHDLKTGKRLERPKICTDELYALMLRCWSEKPIERPSFCELVQLLDVKKRKVYVDFNQISPVYVFPSIKNHSEAVE